MDEPPGHKRTLLERLSAWLLREPEDREDLLQLLRSASAHHIVDPDALAMIEGALQVAETPVREVMIPRAQMDVIDINDTPETFLPTVIRTAHSRFPVIDGERDRVIGILLAKDLLRLFASDEASHASGVRDMLRPVVFVPGSKRLNVLLREFRSSRNHMAIVVDEYGGVAGLVTIEDVLEQIVGDIEDEYDYDEDADNIRAQDDGSWRVKGTTGIEDFNETFGTRLEDDDVNTVAGLVIARLGHLPRRGESLVIDDLRLEVARADSRRLHTLRITRQARPADETA
jgi:magnesium and cobalt transporter